MATFLAVPLKRTWEVDLQKPLKTFITSTFDKIDPEDYNKALQEFHKLRNNVIAKSVDRHESSLEILHRLVAVLTGGTGHCQVPSDSDLIGDSCFLFLICVKQFYRFLSSVIMRKCKLTGIWKLYYCSIHVNLHSFCWIYHSMFACNHTLQSDYGTTNNNNNNDKNDNNNNNNYGAVI